MRYKIIAESNNYYHILHYKNSYDYKGTKRKIAKSNFLYWQQGKINDTDYSNIEKLATKTTAIVPTISDKEKDILLQLHEVLQDKLYILEGSFVSDGHSKALTSRTVRNTELLAQYKLKRIRTNKKLKEKLDINTKGFPFIIQKLEVINHGK